MAGTIAVGSMAATPISILLPILIAVSCWSIVDKRDIVEDDPPLHGTRRPLTTGLSWIDGSVSSTSQTRPAEASARDIMVRILPNISSGAMAIMR